MVPGMDHCAGGAGPDRFDALKGARCVGRNRPSAGGDHRDTAEDGVVERTRPLCPYPKVAVYRGAGSTDDAASFVCDAQVPKSDTARSRTPRRL